MPLKRAAQKAATKTVSVPVGEDTLAVQYYPNRWTLADQLAEKAPDADKTDIPFLLKVLASWDYLDEKDRPIPITRESLMELGLAVYRAVCQAVLDDLYPKRAAS